MRKALKTTLKGDGKCFSLALGFAHQEEKPKAQEWLSLPERKLWKAFRSTKRREHFLLGRVAAKRSAIALDPALKANRISLLPGILGQPVWSECLWETSITHSEGMAFAVSATRGVPVTIDLEPLAAHSAQRVGLLRKRLTRKEKLLSGISERDVIGVWSAKECLGKALRTGISVAHEVLELSGIEKASSHRRYCFRAVPQFEVRQWHSSTWVLSLLFPRDLALHNEVSRWVALSLGGQKAQADAPASTVVK